MRCGMTIHESALSPYDHAGRASLPSDKRFPKTLPLNMQKTCNKEHLADYKIISNG
jgi:hypothetical protein